MSTSRVKSHWKRAATTKWSLSKSYRCFTALFYPRWQAHSKSSSSLLITSTSSRRTMKRKLTLRPSRCRHICARSKFWTLIRHSMNNFPNTWYHQSFKIWHKKLTKLRERLLRSWKERPRVSSCHSKFSARESPNDWSSALSEESSSWRVSRSMRITWAAFRFSSLACGHSCSTQSTSHSHLYSARATYCSFIETSASPSHLRLAIKKRLKRGTASCWKSSTCRPLVTLLHSRYQTS